MRSSTSSPRPAGHRRLDLALAAVALAWLAPFVQALSAQPAARWALTGSVVDQRSVDVTRDAGVLGIDRVVLPDGRLRSDKAPGQPLLAVPFYAVARAVGAEPATVDRAQGNLGLWWVTLWCSVVPFAALLVVLRRTAATVAPDGALPATLALGFGSLLVVYASQLYGHVLAAFVGFAAWAVLRRSEGGSRRVLAAGLLAGAAVAIEYPTAIVAAVLGVAVLVRERERLGWYALGLLPGGLVVAAYDSVAFGAPWRLSYGEKPGHRLGLALPRLHNVAEIVAGSRGLWLLAPVVLVGAVATVVVAARRGPARADALVAAAVGAGFLALQAGWPNPWGGSVPGPRYLVPALPFLVVPLAVSWHRVRGLATALAAWGALVLSVPVVVDHIVLKQDSLVHVYRYRLAHHRFVPTVWRLALGGSGWIVHLALVVAAAAWLWHLARHRPGAARPTPSGPPVDTRVEVDDRAPAVV